MASSTASFGTENGTTDTVTMQVADTTTTDENDEEVETVMRITTGGEAIPYFIGAVVDHNPSNVAEEIEVETSISVADVENEEGDVNMGEQHLEERNEQQIEHEQQQEDIVKYACDLAAVGEDGQIDTQCDKMNQDQEADAEEPSQAEDEEEVTTTKESPKKCEKPSDTTLLSSDFTVNIMCGGGGADGMEGSIENDGNRMVVDLENGDNRNQVSEKIADMKAEMNIPVMRVSCIQWASTHKKQDGEEGGRGETSVIGPIPSMSTTLASSKTSSLPTSPVLMRDEWGNESEEMPDAQNDRMPGISSTSFVAGEEVPPPPPVQTNVGPVSQLQGSVTTLLTALQNPVGNTVLPCCCCVHPCCIVMRELFSSCFPLWSSQSQNRKCSNTANDPTRRSPPPGFEDPPETEWITVNINHIDPSGSLRYKCRNCDGVVEYRSRRQKAFHLNFTRLRFECKKCHRKYLTNKQLLMHSNRHNEKTRVCSVCDKRFLTQIELQNHLNTHTKARPYRCPICFRRFNQTTRYYSHIRDFHKKYECIDCYHSKVCANASSMQTSYKALGQGSPKPSTSARSSL